MRRWSAVIVVMAAFWLIAASSASADDITATCSSDGIPANCSAWFTSDASLVWNATQSPPPMSASCSLGILHQFPLSDTVTQVTCTANWSGESITRTYTLHIEKSTPAVGAALSRPPDQNGWYNHPVTASFTGSSFSGIASCSAPITWSGNDSASASLTGSCTDNAGKTTSTSVPFAYDATPPSVSALPSRQPDHDGWYNHPVTFSFGGTDATSAVAGCSTLTYSGPASGSATVTGTCSDRAGNVAQQVVALRYDATDPSISVSADSADSSNSLRWRVSDVAPAASLDVMRSPGLKGSNKSVVYRGDATEFNDRRVRNGVRYTYTIIAHDQAGNTSAKTISVTPDPRLLAPLSNARVSKPPLLSWTRVRGATYYNVQLYRSGKVLSVWPKHASLQLRGTWKFEGHGYRLKPGRYTWFVWPGFGKRSAAHYGRVIGQGTFVVMPKS